MFNYEYNCVPRTFATTRITLHGGVWALGSAMEEISLFQVGNGFEIA